MGVSKTGPLVSIVIPCHNSERTAAFAIRSATQQTHANLEIICIDDASIDATASILHDFSATDSRVRVLRNSSNLGLGGARNRGLDAANGEYVAFLDDDDSIEPEFVEVLLEAMTLTKSDVAQCGIRYIFDGRESPVVPPAGEISGEQVSLRVDQFDGLPFLTPQSWNKLYRTSLFENVRYSNCAYEDMEIIGRLLKRCRKFTSVSLKLHNYDKRNSRITGSWIANLEKSKWYFDSLLESSTPYASGDYISLLNKWNVPLPGCVGANIFNYVRTLDESIVGASENEKSAILELLLSFEKKLLTMFTGRFGAQLKKQAYQVKNLTLPVTSIFYAPSLEHKRAISRREQFVAKLESTFSRWDRFVPKDPKLWTFGSWSYAGNHTMDNPRALFEAVKRDFRLRKVVLTSQAISGEKVKDPSARRTKVLPLHSVGGLWTLARSGRVFLGYGIPTNFGYRNLTRRPGRRIIQLWHGIPVKRVGLLVSRHQEPYWPSEVKRYDTVISSSERDREVMIASFSPNHPAKVKLTGLPRHDWFAKPVNELPPDYQAWREMLMRRLGGRRLVLYAPTWRHDGPNPANLERGSVIALEAIARRHNAVLGLRYHRNAIKDFGQAAYTSDWVIYLNDIPDVAIILRESEIVITDYSSLYLDFMLLNRSVILFTPDIDTYATTRGFNYTPQEFVPHDYLVRTVDDLAMRLEYHLKTPFEPDASYKKVQAIFHSFEADGAAAQRVIRKMDSLE